MDPGEFYNQTTLPNLTHNIPKEAPIPDKIGPYKIDALLNKGGMSLLYLGLHPEKHTPLVIKVLSPHYLKHQELSEQFLREAKIIGMSDHPNIIKLYGEGEWENGLYIAMEFIQGVSLKQFILQNSLSIKRSLEIILQVAYALLHLHSHGVIHRDLKPENILITEEGGVKVIDFGIAQLVQDESQMKFTQGGLIGTPSYMSPEQKKDPLHISYTTDIFALGVIAYELLIGKLSFGKIHLSYLPAPLQPIIQKAIAPLPQDRYEDIVEFITDVSLYLRSLGSIKTSTPDSQTFIEALEMLQAPILPKTLNHNHSIAFHIAKSKTPLSADLYYESFYLSDGNTVLIVSHSLSEEIESITHLAILKGLIHGLLYENIYLSSKKFKLIPFVTQLNDIIFHTLPGLKFAFGAILLDTTMQQFGYISCGFESLWHISSEGEAPRPIHTDNPSLGSSQDFTPFEALDNWNEGDSLFIHSFNAKSSPASSIIHDLDQKILDYLEDQEEMAVSTQTSALLDLLLNAPESKDSKLSQIVIGIEKQA